MSHILQRLGPRFKDEVRDVVEGSLEEGYIRGARHRFNKSVPSKERNEFTSKLIKHISWLNSPEGRRASTSNGSSPLTVMSDVIEMVLLYAQEQKFSPLQVLDIGFRRAASVLSSPPEFQMISDILKIVLDEADKALESGMTVVGYIDPDSRKTSREIEGHLKAYEGEYRRRASLENDTAWVHFEKASEATEFSEYLRGLKVEVIENFVVPTKQPVSHDFSPLKLSIMRAIWEHTNHGPLDFDAVIEAIKDGKKHYPIFDAGKQADAILDVLATPNDDMLLGGCVEANTIGGLAWDPEQSLVLEDVRDIYKAMMREARQPGSVSSAVRGRPIK